ncbi:MAG: thioredoxin domain-containing protein [Chloroflexi bacterium]|nr:thioredoxin domain-containing protein [Chloroflexota bacterium]
MNRLANETSPYLLQHADNPVDWYPWGDEAFQRARQENRPILLSVGYSACHWCHVMAHESFEDETVAEMMNGLYVNIKVDREERPDVDDIYMNAVQQFSGGHGGWPMTVFLLPDGRPFYGGTYYPPEPRYGMPSFQQVLAGVYDAFRNRRDQVEEAAAQVTGALQRDRLGIGGTPSELTPALLDAAYDKLADSFDPRNGGFGGAPKFPNPMNLEFLLRTAARSGKPEALDHLTLTLRTMARGGIYDQLGGGFHRYSVDAVWLVPHFEKMLYDNAQLSRLYLHAYQHTGDAFFKSIATEVYDYILREMTSPEGGFYSTTDADSEGEEGKFFVWSKAELESLLGDDAPIAIEYWGVSARGNFEGHNILFVPNDDAVVAERLGLSVEALGARLIAIKDRLFAARAQRVPPGLDDKILTAWNGMMLASLAEAARVLDRDDYRVAAVRCAEFFERTLRTGDDMLRRTYKDGQARIDGFLEDYANWIDGLLELYQTTFDRRWFAWARALADHALAAFRADDGGFFDSGDDHERLIARPRSLQDNATPAGASMFAKCLIRLNAYTGVDAYAEAAQRALSLLTAAMREYPQAFGEALNAVDMLVGGLAEVAVVGDPLDEATRALLDVVRKPYRPNAIAALAVNPVEGEDELIPLLSYRAMRAGQPTVYVCRHFTCQMPVTTPEAVAGLL